MMDRGEASALVHIPAGFTDDFLGGTPTTIEVVKNPSERFLPQVVEEGVGIGGSVLSVASMVFRPELEQIKGLMDADGLSGRSRRRRDSDPGSTPGCGVSKGFFSRR